MAERPCPEQPSVFSSVDVQSFGCGTSVGEGEILKGLLARAGYVMPPDGEGDHGTVVLNVCTVKGNTSALREIQRVRETHPQAKLVVTGCVTRELVGLIERIDPNISITTTHAVHDIADTVARAHTEQPVRDLKRSRGSKANLPKIRNNPVIGIVPISQGCLDVCTFCSTRLVKGRLESYPPDDILADVESAVADGCQEIWLTGQDTTCYGFDRDTHLAALLARVVDLPGRFRVRIGMGSPRHVAPYVDALADLLTHPKIFRFVHLPVQSGSDEVLQAMGRAHTVACFYEIVARLRAQAPDLTLSTDIMVGFPGETDPQFEASIELIRRVRPTVCNRTRFVARPDTMAARQPNSIGSREMKRRSRRLDAVFREVARDCHQAWIGWEGEVLVDEPGRTPGTWMTRNDAYKLIAVASPLALGQTLRVRVTGGEAFFLRGEPVAPSA